MNTLRFASKGPTAARSDIPMDYRPMEAKSVPTLPEGSAWLYEPKWDGFRCIAFRNNGSIELRSKSGQSLGRYFPEIVESLSRIKAKRFVLDGELVIQAGRAVSFDDLLQRIHPAKSRVERLSKETPASYVLFDLLLSDTGENLTGKSLPARREKLLQFQQRYLREFKDIVVTPSTESALEAKRWLISSDNHLDGVIAKRTDMPYQSGNRLGMVKVKHKRTADCVIGGFRYGANSKEVGSLLLGLYDESGELHHVGFTSTIGWEEREKLTRLLEKLKTENSFTINVPGAPSRWSTERSADWVPLKPQIVLEVQFDQVSNGRFRHATKLIRWRPDKLPVQCTLEQIEKQTK